MGRSIYADKLKADLEKAISKNEDMDCLDFLRIASVIDKQPTAYDPEKVVEQLETMRMRYYLTYANTGNKTNDEVWEKVSRAVNIAIEIVKGGGVNAKTDS